MKNSLKVFGIIVFAAVIGFSFTACGVLLQATLDAVQQGINEGSSSGGLSSSGGDLSGGSSSSGGGYSDLNGAWVATTNTNFAAAGTVLNFSGDGAVIAQVGSNTLWQTAQNRGFIRAGTPFIRYIASTDNNNYGCELLVISFSGDPTNNPTVTGTKWVRGGITLNSNGTIQIGYGSGQNRGTFRRN